MILMPSVFRSSTPVPTRLFSRAAGALVVLLGIISAAPAFAIVGEWSTPVTLSWGPGLGALEQQVAVYGAGNAVAVWVREDASNSTSVVQSSSSSDGGVSYSTPEDLSAPSQATFAPQIAVDDEGNAVAVWSRYNDSFPDPDQIVQSSWSSDGGVTWSTPEDLSAAGQDAYDPQVAVNDAGNPVAVWRRYDGSDDVVQFSGSSDGGVSWSTPVTLSVAGADAYGLGVAVNDAGNAVAVWRRYNGSHYVVQSSGSSDFGSGGEELAPTGAGGFVNNTALVASVGLLALGALTRVFVRRRGVENGR